jgi:hypothetical protein
MKILNRTLLFLALLVPQKIIANEITTGENIKETGSCMLCYILRKRQGENYTYVITDLRLLKYSGTGEIAYKNMHQQCIDIKSEMTKSRKRQFDYTVTNKYLNVREVTLNSDYPNGLVSEFDINDKFARSNSDLRCENVLASKYSASVEYYYPNDSRTENEKRKDEDRKRGYPVKIE